MALLIDGMYRIPSPPKPKPTAPKPEPKSATSAPVDGSDRRLYAMAAEKSGDKKVLQDFDAALKAQSQPAPPKPTTTSSSPAPKDHVQPQRAEDPSDQKFYNMAADRQNKIIDLESRATSLQRDIVALGTSGGYATDAMRAELIEVKREIDALSRTHVSGDGDAGGTYSSEVRRPFETGGADRADTGRAVIERALQDTADGRQIQRDEFEVVELDNGKFILVLPGVIDLSSPHLGWDPDNRSVRDTDMAAFRSSTSAELEDNRYAVMVRDYMNRHVPRGADVMIVGHSFGADTALDLASDPTFNNRDTGFNVTHVTAAAYYSQPQLRHVQNDTEVLVLQNAVDVPVLAEAGGYTTSRDLLFAHDTGREAWAINRSYHGAVNGVARDAVGEVGTYLSDGVAEVPEFVGETVEAAQDIEEGGRDAGRGAWGIATSGLGWLGRSAVNSLETTGNAVSSLAQGDVRGAGSALTEGHADQNAIDAAAGTALREHGADFVSGVGQQADAVGGWTWNQAERVYERTVTAPAAHAGEIAGSAVDHGRDFGASVHEHGGNIVEDVADRDIYDLGPRLGSPGISPFLPTHRDDQVVARFPGGTEGAGHHQNNYIDYINGTDNAEVRGYFESVANAGYSGAGRSLAVDVSVPED